MKLNQLKALIALSDGHGIAGAAKQLHVSMPAISRSMANILSACPVLREHCPS